MSPKSETPPKAGSNENAERLKAQGNALHVQGQYKAAYKKYSEAIKEDPTNAVLWANRAASGLGMKEYQHTLTKK
jgi:Flp pilus assembly protein TadD